MANEVLFNPFPKQMEFLNCIFSKKYNFILYGGAIRGGKTFAGLGALLLLAKIYPNSKWVVVRDTLQTLKRTTIPSFGKICPTAFIKNYNQDTQTVTFTNGSQLLFFGENYADDKELNRFKGLECNGFLLEEMNEMQELTFNKCIERAGSHIIAKQPPPLILGTCNPANNWVKDKVYNRWKANDMPDNWLYIPSKITDNPYIPADYLESLKSMPKYQYEVFVEGNWDIQLKVGGEFYKCFELEKHVGACSYDPSLPLHISFDENVNPYLPIGIFQIERKNIKQIAEIAGVNPNNTIKAVCSEFKRKYQGHTAGLFIYGDATSQKADVKLEKGHNFFRLIMDELKEYHPQLRVAKSNPSVAMRGNFFNQVLNSEYDGITFKIDDSCKRSINDFILTKEAADGTKNKEMETDGQTKVRYQKTGHFTDLTDYLLCYAFAESFTKYQRGDIGQAITIGKVYSKNSY